MNESRNDGTGTVWYVTNADHESDTAAFAAELAARADAGTMLALDGDIGAGKTLFAKAFASALGIPGIVNSPTFTIIKEYEGGRLPLYHMDVYRLSLSEADELGLDEYFLGEGVSLVEWAILIEPILPPDRLHIVLENTGPTSRRIRCRPIGSKYEAWCRHMGLAPEEGTES
jgi:tRNA threonylcarbamoyladenosine biosynthesis protein TsaE